MKRSIIAVYCISIFLLVSCYDSKNINTAAPSPEAPSQISEILSELNSWYTEELYVFECHKQFPGRVASSQTGGWALSHKRLLKDLGIYVRWNCVNQAYEIIQEEDSTPVCNC
jgi:hypothetical protein